MYQVNSLAWGSLGPALHVCRLRSDWIGDWFPRSESFTTLRHCPVEIHQPQAPITQYEELHTIAVPEAELQPIALERPHLYRLVVTFANSNWCPVRREQTVIDSSCSQARSSSVEVELLSSSGAWKIPELHTHVRRVEGQAVCTVI
jgi:hypothetical protein